MLNNKKVVVVMPAYNASKTLDRTYSEIPFPLVDEVILVDDNSSDDTYIKARELGIKHVIKHEKNRGYGGNQKTCYAAALKLNADIVIMVHPDYQYTPKLIPAMAEMLTSGLYEVVLGSRILGTGALKGGMPFYKYFANRVLTFTQNLLVGAKLSEYHTGYRAFTKEAIQSIDISKNSDNFIFDNQMLSQLLMKGYEIAEITCPTKYFDEGSSINFKNSTIYGLGVLKVSIQHRLKRMGIYTAKIYQ
ncbi:glycosyltransferase family 2 protein [Acidiluteibacter ferrifornacis]|jgi:glycosyltransferase involved in cell wall biosynthesis|uniref:Glycosyltransferase n=1 Tax=Acidiluteibacter ferrifornacis TaxID=2692424 RepID=A0A6N9NL96_9FLAO|nr:glycosyltransferase family 2 protein [Acidiluteibacter ferrifornacis]NBG66632.1 glycosyltransferase [Acidiluteibacter ferrifornacis]